MSLQTCIRLAAFAAALVSQSVARADLSWFDLAVSEDRPHVSMADVIAWSDACMDIKDAEWPAVEGVYATYVKQWAGDGRDEDKLWDGLKTVLGTERVGCVEAFRASTDAVLRTRDSSPRHIAVRRELIALASTRGAGAADAQRLARELAGRIADSVAERSAIQYDDVPPVGEVLAVRDAVVQLRGNLAALLGEERADTILANIVQAYELSGTTALAPEFRAIIEHATMLSKEQREALAAAYADADAAVRSKAAYEAPRDARVKADEDLYRRVESIIGAERADLVRSLAGGYVDVRADLEATGPQPNVPLPDMMNSAADALLARFVGPDQFPALESAFGRGFWRPLSWHGVRPKEPRMPAVMDMRFLVAVSGAKGDDELAIVESIHADYARRFAQGEHAFNTIMSKQGRLAAIADLLIDEDARALAELQTAIGRERITDGTVALARFARLERTLPFSRMADRFDTLSRIPWPTGSAASVVFGDPDPGIAPLPGSRLLAMRAILEQAAPSLLEGRLAAWNDVKSASDGFERVMEQFAGVSNIAREKLVAMQAARLEGLAACSRAARRSYVEAITLMERLLGEEKRFEAQYFALALIEQDLGRTDAGRRLVGELARVESPESRDRALAALVPMVPSATEVLRACSDAAVAAGNMDDGDLARIEAGTVVLDLLKDARRRLDRAMRAQVAVSWRELRAAGSPSAQVAFRP